MLGGIAGAVEEEHDVSILGGALIGTLFFAPAGALLGAIIGLVATGADETIQIEGMSDLEIREALNKLRKKARIRNFQ